jgi:uncharacterized protein YdhG (YjbR/CyaY superfamily)
MDTKKYLTIEEYKNDFSSEVADILSKVLKTIALAAPEAVECIAYNMPAFKLHKKPLVYFAAYKNHIGFYALPSGNAAFQKELSNYKIGKGSIQFPLNQEIPYDLIRQITEFRVIEVMKVL